ncbi:hypothetical protein [Paraburkholderia sp. J41]|uniref:hypothetical protein n=1 Tax=Paraburkholderia sp. J41 TaxID=2805433 RepID=UPI002AC34769|nr:hypothetical protein [Paraburkholderia sp. J41]
MSVVAVVSAKGGAGKRIVAHLALVPARHGRTAPAVNSGRAARHATNGAPSANREAALAAQAVRMVPCAEDRRVPAPARSARKPGMNRLMALPPRVAPVPPLVLCAQIR